MSSFSVLIRSGEEYYNALLHNLVPNLQGCTILHAGDLTTFENMVVRQKPDLILSEFMCSEGTIIQIHDFVVKYLPRVPIIAIAPSIEKQKIEHLLYTVGFSDYVRDDDYTRIYMSILKEMHNKQKRIVYQRKQDHINITSLVSEYNDKGIIITDKFTRIEWVNSKITEICGYEQHEIIGKYAGKLLQGPLTEESTVEEIRTNLRKEIRFESELINYHKDGWPYWVHIDVTPLFYDGKLTRYVAIEEDISENKPLILHLHSG